MNRLLSFRRLSLIFLCLFAVLVGGTLLVQRFWLDPVTKCEEKGSWWFAEEKRCVTPVYIPDITKRAPGVSRAEASEARNRELAAIESRAIQEKAARAAETARQRAALEN